VKIRTITLVARGPSLVESCHAAMGSVGGQ